jgi:hypothetical protein
MYDGFAEEYLAHASDSAFDAYYDRPAVLAVLGSVQGAVDSRRRGNRIRVTVPATLIAAVQLAIRGIAGVAAGDGPSMGSCCGSVEAMHGPKAFVRMPFIAVPISLRKRAQL